MLFVLQKYDQKNEKFDPMMVHENNAGDLSGDLLSFQMGLLIQM